MSHFSTFALSPEPSNLFQSKHQPPLSEHLCMCSIASQCTNTIPVCTENISPRTNIREIQRASDHFLCPQSILNSTRDSDHALSRVSHTLSSCRTHCRCNVSLVSTALRPYVLVASDHIRVLTAQPCWRTSHFAYPMQRSYQDTICTLHPNLRRSTQPRGSCHSLAT